MVVMGLTPYLFIAATLFCLGIFCVLTRRNSVSILVGIELMLNAANLNIVAFSRFVADPIGGQTFAILTIILAASEAVIFLGLLMAVYQRFDTIEVDKLSLLKDEVPAGDVPERA